MKSIYAVAALVALSCGQAAPEPESTMPLDSRRESVEVNRDELRAPADEALSAPPTLANANAAVSTKPVRCDTDLLPRDEPAVQQLAAAAASPRRPFPRGPIVREPLRPEVIETLPPP